MPASPQAPEVARTAAGAGPQAHAQGTRSHPPPNGKHTASDQGRGDPGLPDHSAARGPRRVDISSGEDTTLATLPSSDSSMPGSEAFDRRQRDRSLRAEDPAIAAAAEGTTASTGVPARIDLLNELLECCRDGEYGFTLCAEHVQNPDLRRQMSRHADECRVAARELVEHIRALGGVVDAGGSLLGSVHRGWVSLRGTLAGYSDRALAEEAERGEDMARAHYRRALGRRLPPALRELLQRQYAGLLRNHEDMRHWRERLHDRV